MAILSSSLSSHSSTKNHVRGTEITQQEFFSFHHIDRLLYYKMVFHLRREPGEAMQVSAFWLWLERITMAQYIKIILNFPDAIIEAILEESLICLRFIETDVFTCPDDDTYDIPMIQSIIGNNKFCLKYFYDNRIKIILGVGNIIQQVCLRAFQDFFQVVLPSKKDEQNNHHYSQCISQPSMQPPNGIDNTIGIQASLQPQTPFYNQNIKHYLPTIKVGELNVCLPDHLYPDNTHMHTQEALAGIFGRTNMNHQFCDTQETRIPTSERTIFLTFSKGYPISELELREFLIRSFGDIIDALYMQEVGAKEQPLYARLVVRDLSAMTSLLSGQSKAKFSINGKHAWARKFVRKNPNSPPHQPNSTFIHTLFK